MSRQASPLPWLPATPTDGLVPIRDPMGDDVLFAPNTGDLINERNIQVIACMTKLLAGFRAMTLPQIRAELARIAALSIASILAAGVTVLLLVLVGSAGA